MRDEARHVSFGHTYLGPLIQKMNDDDREDLAQFAFEAINLIIAAERKGGGYGTAANRFDPGFLRVLEACQIDAEDFFAGMSEAAELGITTELPPGHVLAVKQFMMPAMVRVGLVTERTAKLFEEAGIRVNTDTAVLNAMEDAKSDQNVLHEESTTY
jgi:hypothetical protein